MKTFQRANFILFLASAIFVYLPIVLVVIWLPFFPDLIPAHYNGSGVVDRMGSKYELLLFPLINVIIALIFLLTYLIMKRKNEEFVNNKRILLVFNIICLITFLAFNIMTIYFTTKAYKLVNHINEINLYQILSLIGSFVFLLIGLIFLFVKPNCFIGIRTKKTLSNNVIWKKVNLISGILYIVSSVALIIFNLLYSNKYINLIIFGSIISFITIISILVSLFINGETTKNEEEV